MKEVQVEANATVIEQGAQGDYFYVVESGTLDVYVRSPPRGDDPSAAAASPLGDKKVSYGPALPSVSLLCLRSARAATVLSHHHAHFGPWTVSLSVPSSWRPIRVVVRSTKSSSWMFPSSTTFGCRTCQDLGLARVARVLSQPSRHHSGRTRSEFFIIVEGDAEVRKTKEAGKEEVVGKLSRGDYFGELALLNNAHLERRPWLPPAS